MLPASAFLQWLPLCSTVVQCCQCKIRLGLEKCLYCTWDNLYSEQLSYCQLKKPKFLLFYMLTYLLWCICKYGWVCGRHFHVFVSGKKCQINSYHPIWISALCSFNLLSVFFWLFNPDQVSSNSLLKKPAISFKYYYSHDAILWILLNQNIHREKTLIFAHIPKIFMTLRTYYNDSSLYLRFCPYNVNIFDDLCLEKKSPAQ